MDSNNILPPILDRISSVCFSEQSIDKKVVETLFESARWAPSAFNYQPWRFIYALKKDGPEYEKICSLLLEGNRMWAEKAPLLILSIASLISDYTKKENFYATHDTGLATANLLIQAVSMGLQVHPMAGFDKEKAKTELNIPNYFEPVAMIAVGYKGDINELPDELKSRETKPRIRKEQKEFVFKGSWER